MSAERKGNRLYEKEKLRRFVTSRSSVKKKRPNDRTQSRGRALGDVMSSTVDNVSETGGSDRRLPTAD